MCGMRAIKLSIAYAKKMNEFMNAYMEKKITNWFSSYDDDDAHICYGTRARVYASDDL